MQTEKRYETTINGQKIIVEQNIPTYGMIIAHITERNTIHWLHDGQFIFKRGLDWVTYNTKEKITDPVELQALNEAKKTIRW